jgi:riboflavin synthase
MGPPHHVLTEHALNLQVVIALPPGRASGIQIGASVAINGTCLTVTEIYEDKLAFDIMVETLRATNLSGLRAGAQVNYERSARFGDEIGGESSRVDDNHEFSP